MTKLQRVLSKSPASRRRKSPASRRRRKSPAGRRRRKSPAGRSRGGNVFSQIRGMFRKNSDEAADRRYDDLFNMYEKLRRRLRYSVEQILKISPSYWDRDMRRLIEKSIEDDFPDRERFMNRPSTRDFVNERIKLLFELVSSVEKTEEDLREKMNKIRGRAGDYESVKGLKELDDANARRLCRDVFECDAGTKWRRCYLKRARVHHPDKEGGDTKIFQHLQACNERLRD